jgi:uncharacterized protein (DUF2126 family)
LQLWDQWSSEYLHNWQHRQSWHHATPNLKSRDVILLKDDITTPLQWPIAVITDVHPEPDGNIQVVTVKTAKRQALQVEII